MDSLPDRIAELIRQGRKLEAIRLIREETGVGLEEAKDAVEALSRGEDPLEPEPHDPIALPEDVRALARAGRKVEAVKLVRERTGLGLKEAVQLVEAIPGARTAARRGLVLAAVILVMLIGMALALLIAAGCAPAPVVAGPVHAGPMVAPPADDLSGGYTRTHTVHVLDADEWTPVEVQDTLALRQDGDRLDVSFTLVFSNAHLCSMEGTALREDGAYVLRDTLDLFDGLQVCALRVVASADSITLHDEEGVCRRYYCGARGYIDGAAFPR